MMEKMEDIDGIDDIDGMEEIELKPDDDSRLIVLIIYDIVDNKRRTSDGEVPLALCHPRAEVVLRGISHEEAVRGNGTPRLRPDRRLV